MLTNEKRLITKAIKKNYTAKINYPKHIKYASILYNIVFYQKSYLLSSVNFSSSFSSYEGKIDWAFFESETM